MPIENEEKAYRKVIDQLSREDCCCESPCENKYCILKEIIFHSHRTVQNLYQIKCIELFRKDLEKDLEMNIEPNYATKKWVEDEYNVLFRKHFDENIPCNEIYRRIVEDTKIAKNSQK